MIIPKEGPDLGNWIIFYSTDTSIMMAKSLDNGENWQISTVAEGLLLDAVSDNKGNYYILASRNISAVPNLFYIKGNATNALAWTELNFGHIKYGYPAAIVVQESGEIHMFWNSESNGVIHAYRGIPPIPVTALKAEASSNKVTLSWVSQLQDVWGYSLFRGLGTDSLSLIANVSIAIHSYVDLNVTNEQTYYYAVRPFNQYGYAEYYQIVNATPSSSYGEKPSNPRYLISTNCAEKGVSLQWDMPIFDGGGMSLSYNIYRGETASSLTLIGNTKSLNYTDKTAEGNRFYYYQVRAVNEFGEGLGTNIIQAWSVPYISSMNVEVSPDKYYIYSESSSKNYDIRVVVYGGNEKVENATVTLEIEGTSEYFSKETGSDGSVTFKDVTIKGSYLHKSILIKASRNNAFANAVYGIEKTPDSMILNNRLFNMRFFFASVVIGAVGIPTTYYTLLKRRNKLDELEKNIDILSEKNSAAVNAVTKEFETKKENKDEKMRAVLAKLLFDTWKIGIERVRDKMGVISGDFINSASLIDHSYNYMGVCKAKEQRVKEYNYETRKLITEQYPITAEPKLDTAKYYRNDKKTYYTSCRVDTCNSCGGQKKTTCPKCDGKKEVRCPQCSGSKVVNCPICGGTGEVSYEVEVKCVKCGGKGYVKKLKKVGSDMAVTRRDTVVKYDSYDNGITRTRTWTPVTRETTGYVDKYDYVDEDCPACNGSGYISETKYRNCEVCKKSGKLRCEECAGKGNIICKECSGDGKVICEGCNGEGKQNVYKVKEWEYTTHEYNEYVNDLKLDANKVEELSPDILTFNGENARKVTQPVKLDGKDEKSMLGSFLHKCSEGHKQWKRKNNDYGDVIFEDDLSISAVPVTEGVIKRNDINKYNETKEFKIFAIGTMKKWCLDCKEAPFVREERFEEAWKESKNTLERYETDSRKTFWLIMGLECSLWIIVMLLLFVQVLPQL
ncbi:MAG: hypothetical protein QXT63_03185 [Thermoplasmata archaeon]